MNWDKIKEALSLHNLKASDLPSGVLGLLSLVLLVIAFRSAKFMSKTVVGLAALVLAGAAVWWHYHNR